MQALVAALKEAKDVQGGLEFDAAIDQCAAVKEQLTNTEKQARAGRLQPDFGQTPQTAFESYMQSKQALNESTDQLLKSCQEKDAATAGLAAKSVGNNMRALGSAVQAIAATADDNSVPLQVTGKGKDLCDKVMRDVGWLHSWNCC